MRQRRHLAAATVVAAALLPAAAIAQTPADPLPIGLSAAAPVMRWDPAVRFGRLPNGLRYVVAHNGSPKGAVSLRLALAVGSYQEAEDERGAAHLLEHLAFEATRSFGATQAALTFAPVKMTFGPDRNAQSDLAVTTYRIDLPTEDAKELTAAERWLREAGDGLVFAEPAVARARAALDAERTARAGVLTPFRARVDAFEDGALRSGARPALGVAAATAGLTPARLQSFYDRWYRPENAVVVVVGDLPLDAMEGQVKAAFGDWTGRGAPGAVPAQPAPADAGLEVMSETVPGATPVVRLCRVTGPDATDGPPPQRLRTLLLREVWRAVLQRRLNVLGTRADAPFVQTNVSTDLKPDARKTCIAIAPVKGGETRAIALVQGVFKGFAAEGPTVDEIDIATGQLRAIIEGAVGAAPPAASQAGELLQRALDGMPQLNAREGVRAFDILLDDVQPAAVKAQFESDWADRGPLATVAGPDAVPEAAIRQAMAAPAATSGAPEVLAVRADGSVRRSPDQLAQFQRAEAALKAGQLKAAMRDFDDLAHANPRDADAIAGRGRVFVAEGKADAALKTFAEALAVDPYDGVALNARGALHLQMNDAEAAIPDFDKALALAPSDDVVLYNRGLAYKLLHRYDRAIRDFDAALKAAPGDALTLSAKADAYRRAGDLLLAREFYDAALAAQPRLAEALDGRGQVKETLGDAAGGAADRAKARALDPSLPG